MAIYLERGLLRERFLAAVATSGGWSSIKQLFVFYEDETNIETLSLREAEHISSFINQSENLHSLSLSIVGDEAVPIVDTLYRTNEKVLVLNMFFRDTFSLQNGGRQLATAVGRCTFITDLQLFVPTENKVELELFQLLLVESIPKMLGLKKFKLVIDLFDVGRIVDMVGQCIGLHQGEIEYLTLDIRSASVNTSIVGLTPALRRLKAIRFHGAALTLQQIGELSGIVADCDTLEEFGYNFPGNMSTDDFKAICQLLSKFPGLKRVAQEPFCREVDLREAGRLTAFLEMVKTSKTIEEVPSFRCGNAKEEAAINYHCLNNMIHSRIHEEGLLTANTPDSAWPLILGAVSVMPDVLYYLLHQKNGAMIGPSRHGRKRKQDFGDGRNEFFCACTACTVVDEMHSCNSRICTSNL